jgi:hypothetical protein
VEAVLKRKAELSILHPELNQTESVFLKIDLQAKEIMKKASLVSTLARKVYNKDYQDEQKISTGGNPCADFKF